MAGKEGDKQFMGDLLACTDDIDAFRDCMKHYGVNDPKNAYVLHNADFRTCNTTFRNIQKRLNSDKDKKFLILYVLAGHGMNVKGQQVVLLNEFDKQSNWYKMLNVEAKIRVIAQMNPNSYQLAFFACCREIYDKTYHIGAPKGTVPDKEEPVEDIVD